MINRDIETRISEIDGEIAALQDDIDIANKKKFRLEIEINKLEALIEEGDYEQDEGFLREGFDAR